MKTFLCILLLFLEHLHAHSQYCGYSGPSNCSPIDSFPPGYFTPSSNLPCLVNIYNPSLIIQFKAFDSLDYSGQRYELHSMHIDSLENLPSGLCWRSNKSNNSYIYEESGCVLLDGIPFAIPGQYKLRLQISADIGLSNLVTLSPITNLYLRVVNQGDLCPELDTTQTVPFVPYLTGIKEMETKPPVCVASNPSHNGQWYFDAPEGLAGHELLITDLAGRTVYQGITSKANQLNLGYLQTGVYLLKLGDKVVRLVKD